MRLFDDSPYDTYPKTRFEKIPTGRNVHDETIARFEHLWANYRTVLICFSTGKDSQVAADIATKTAPAGRKPVVLYEDSELMPTGSLPLAEAMAANPAVDFVWSTTPTTFKNHWMTDGQWTTWDPNRQWHRPRPPQSQTLPGSRHGEDNNAHRRRWITTLPQPVISVVACRAAEAAIRLIRIKLSARQGNDPCWVFKMGHCWPLYDWRVGDIWKYIADHQLHYNQIYDRYAQTGIRPGEQRIGLAINHPANPAARKLSVIDPPLYAACLALWPGFAGLIRYAADNRISGYKRIPNPPAGQTWMERIRRVVASNPDPDARAYLREEIIRLLRLHIRRADGEPILAHTMHPTSGISWELLTRTAIRGERHHGPSPGRTIPNMVTNARHWKRYNQAKQWEPHQ